MNERIRELIEQATIRGEEYLPGNDGHPTPTVYFDKEKFAELIVAECIDVFSKDLPEDSGKMLEVVNRVCNVAEHFGVEE